MVADRFVLNWRIQGAKPLIDIWLHAIVRITPGKSRRVWEPTEPSPLRLRFHYLWNSENDQPFVGFGFKNIQAGQSGSRQLRHIV